MHGVKAFFAKYFSVMRRWPVMLAIFGCLVLVAGGSVLAIHARTVQRQKAALAKGQHDAQAKPKVAKVQPPSAAPASATTTPTTPPAAAPTPKTQPGAKPAANPVPKPQLSPCDQNRSAFYVQHTAAINQEYQTHQQNVATLKQHYDNGDYYETSNEQAYADYLADVDDENARWQQAGAAIDATYKAQLQSVGCPVYL